MQQHHAAASCSIYAALTLCSQADVDRARIPTTGTLLPVGYFQTYKAFKDTEKQLEAIGEEHAV